MGDDTYRLKLDAAVHIVSRLVHSGYTALFAGGYVRDMLLKNNEKGDIDIATDATPQAIITMFDHTIAVGAQFGVVIVMYQGIPFEVATFRSDVGIRDGRHPEHIVFTDARQDALRRDFTINGMFYDPLTDRILDYVSGREDLKAKRIRAIGDPGLRFSEDYLRLLRAIRFAARFDFSIDAATWAAIQTHAGHIVEISSERIFAELDKMLRQPHPDRAFTLLYESGLLRYTLPEVADCAGVEQPPEYHPEGDVLAHTMKALGLLAPNPSSILAWSVLLHDIGKKVTMYKADRIRFNNHHVAGAAMAGEILRRLRAPNCLIDSVSACVENHMNFMNVSSMRLSTLKKFLSRPTINDELELHRVDCLASHGSLENYDFVKSKLSEFARERLKPAPLLRGNDLIGFGLEPGPLFGEILREVYDAQLEEKIRTRNEALALVRKKWVERSAD